MTIRSTGSEGGPIRMDWPRFIEGERLVVKGVEFELQRINRSTLVLRPVTQPYLGAQSIIQLLMGQMKPEEIGLSASAME